MKLLQPSFARGEISPLLHARVDLASYATGTKKLENFIVLPQGGITRRPGFKWMGTPRLQGLVGCPVRLIPFRYNSEDAMIVELTQSRARFWTRDGIVMKDGVPYEIPSPYNQAMLKDIKYVQSGNVLFLAHRSYPVQQLTRYALDDWTLGRFEFEDGPWLTTDTEGITIVVTIRDSQWCLTPSDPDYFKPEMAGSLIRLDYTIEGSEVKGKSEKAPDWGVSDVVEIGGDWYFETHGNWIGQVQIQKSLDGGKTWLTIRTYTRGSSQEEGQLNTSGAEIEKNVIYRVRAQHTGDNVMDYSLNVSGYVKSYIFRLDALQPDGSFYATRIFGDNPPNVPFPFDVESKEWELGAWSFANGYPGAIGFYQDRLVLAGSKKQPQTIWMSKTGDYKNFGISDPIRDDDAINITLAADDMDGIHSVLAMTDILVFTPSGEWKISGSGENGAISPKAVVAHQQTTIGSRSLQPALLNHRVVFVQTHGTEVHALGYSLDQDGYSGTDISILSQHLFNWKTRENVSPAGREIVGMTYQQVPDSLLWFILEDGTAVTCTYQAEHEVVAWARQTTGSGTFGDLTCIPGDGYTQLWAAIARDGIWGIEVLNSREMEISFEDAPEHSNGPFSYESILETLRVNYDSQRGAAFPDKKLIARLDVLTVRSKKAWIAPGANASRSKRREIRWNYSPELSESEIQLDSGFERGANVQIWTGENDPLTILGVSPIVTAGG